MENTMTTETNTQKTQNAVAFLTLGDVTGYCIQQLLLEYKKAEKYANQLYNDVSKIRFEVMNDHLWITFEFTTPKD
jgi:uncharacterized protein YgiM (DUF1202 family)